MNNFKIFKNKKILITGHTGFKGSWLTLWLSLLGARVTGISFGYPTFPSHFKVIKIAKRINHKILDIRNFQKIKKTIKKIQLVESAAIKVLQDQPVLGEKSSQ